mgnify:CR=1 FL=1
MSSFTAEKAKLFDDSSDDDEVEEAVEEEDEELQAAKVLNVGNSYAQRYNDWRRKEELSKLKQKYGDHLDVPSEVEGSGDDDSGDDGEDVDDEEDSDESSDDDDDDDDSLHDDPFDEQFLKVYSALKNKAPEIYDKDFAAASKGDDDEDSSAEEEGATKKSPQKGKTAAAAAQKKFTLQDYHQKLIKEKKGVTEEDEQMLGGDASEDEAEKPSGYYEELYNIRREIKDIARGENNFSDDDDGDQFFSIKESGSPSKKTTEPGAKKKHGKDDQQKEQLISQIWSKSSGDKKASADTGDDFLKDYILNKRYLDPTLTSSVVKRFKAEPASHFGGFEKAAEVADDNDSSEEEEDEEDDDDEQQKSSEPAIAKYHYEEPDATVIKRYPRAIDSIRDTINEKDKKSHRAEVRERKKAEKTAELKRLRRLKREEIEAKIAQLKAVSGASSFDVKDLDLNVIVDDENEFDGAKYDEKMNLLFGDEYYDVNGADETKPSFEYVPEIDDDLYGDESEKVNKGVSNTMKPLLTLFLVPKITGQKAQKEAQQAGDQGAAGHHGRRRYRPL